MHVADLRAVELSGKKRREKKEKERNKVANAGGPPPSVVGLRCYNLVGRSELWCLLLSQRAGPSGIGAPFRNCPFPPFISGANFVLD